MVNESDAQLDQACLAALRAGRPTAWVRPAIANWSDVSPEIRPSEVEGARLRMARFAPVLRMLFASEGWDGRVASTLIALDSGPGGGELFLKADHDLPMTGSIKARGGVHELLAYVEEIALDNALLDGGSYLALTSQQAQEVFARYTVVVASTGNLGYSIGLVARAFGLSAEVHMSHEAKSWKKERLKALGAIIVEHMRDYSQTVSHARTAAAAKRRAYFVDDENSRRLFTGFAVAAQEVADQLQAAGVEITAERPLVVYLPCGVGGAPGGITYGLKQVFGDHVVCVLVEPVESACMLVAMATGGGMTPSAYEYGRKNQTIADGLAVAQASKLVVDVVGNAIDAVVTVSEQAMLNALRWAWKKHGLRLEPAAAAAFAGREDFHASDAGAWRPPPSAVEIVWATGGSQLPEAEFCSYL